jgi:hypothetical protein
MRWRVTRDQFLLSDWGGWVIRRLPERDTDRYGGMDAAFP